MDLVDRLSKLMDRYEIILERAMDWQSKAELAQRLGVNPAGPDPLIFEIQSKVNEQLGLCGESITLLLKDRAFPIMFKKSVKKAEAFADQCEAVLASFDLAEQAGKAAFQDGMKS
jgi:hypothetical protein